MADKHENYQAAQSNEFEILIERIKLGAKVEQDDILHRLGQHAKTTNNPEDWNLLALGLQAASRFEQAVEIFEWLVVQSLPEKDLYRLNLATTYSQTRQFELCQYHLQELAEHGCTKEFRQLGQQQLEGLERFLKQTEQDRLLRQLQLDSLRERIQSGHPSVDNFQRLGRLLIEMHVSNPEQSWLDEAISILEQGRQLFPDAVGILEYLARCYLSKDPYNRLEEVVKKLEKVAPDSKVLEILGDIDDSQSREFQEQQRQRTHKLLELSQSKDPKLRTAALQELQKIVGMSPENPEYRGIYAFALGAAGQYEAAIHQAQLVADIAPETHEMHFNLGQIFWLCGDVDRGRHHLELSLKYAKNEQQRQDVMARIVDLSRR
jgi:tetratricopeptide (TPR) repeat protein